MNPETRRFIEQMLGVDDTLPDPEQITKNCVGAIVMAHNNAARDYGRHGMWDKAVEHHTRAIETMEGHTSPAAQDLVEGLKNARAFAQARLVDAVHGND